MIVTEHDKWKDAVILRILFLVDETFDSNKKKRTTLEILRNGLWSQWSTSYKVDPQVGNSSWAILVK